MTTNDSFLTVNVALVGNPNCGKTTIFNKLTGEKCAVGNYSGVTVDKAEGRLQQGNTTLRLVDLPGVYSLTTLSKDEIVARDFLLLDSPDVIVNVLDSSNLERNLFLTLQLLELGIPLVVVLNMCDLAKSRGIVYNAGKLSEILNVPVVEVVGVNGHGLEIIISTILEMTGRKDRPVPDKEQILAPFSQAIECEIETIENALEEAALNAESRRNTEDTTERIGLAWLITGRRLSGDDWDNVRCLSSSEDQKKGGRYKLRRRWLAIKLLEKDPKIVEAWNDPHIQGIIEKSQERIGSKQIPTAAKLAAERYAIVRKIYHSAVKNEKKLSVLWSDRADRILTHPVWGLGLFLLAMYLVFWLTFAVGNIPVRQLENLLDLLSNYLDHVWRDTPDSLLHSMIVDGVIGGVGGVLVFFPNIFILFAAISVLEESGYMARGAFLTDRFLRRWGLTGKSFIPMLVGFGCSIPAIMSTRIIEDRKARLTTMFVVPLMSCGARFPIYVLIIPAFFVTKWQAPVLWCVYFAGIVVAGVVSKFLSVTAFQGQSSPLLIELPTYHTPTLRTVGARAMERGWQYLKKAGTTILGVSLTLWAISTFPGLPKSQLEIYQQEEKRLQALQEQTVVDSQIDSLDSQVGDLALEETSENIVTIDEIRQKIEANQLALAGAKLEHSLAGRLGKAIEPVISYAGFDWKIGTALIGALAAKELFVAQLGIVFKVGDGDEDSKSLREAFRQNYSPLTGICVIVFCLIGAPCFATFVVTSKEASLRWALFQWGTLTALGFTLAVVVYQIGGYFGWGT